jgi:hypothetical protein
MSSKIVWILFLVSLGVNAEIFQDDLTKAPPSFSYSGKTYVFIDLKNIKYNIVFDIKNKVATATSILDFETKERGYPIFDLKGSLISSNLNGQSAAVSDIPFPNNESWAKAVMTEVGPGLHQLVTVHNIKTNIEFSANHVDAGFWLSDLSDRNFMETYLPANLEYDQSPVQLELTFVGTTATHMVYTNSIQTTKLPNSTIFSYPDHFTSSSLFFHVTKKGKFSEKTGYYKSKDGRLIPILVYGKWLTDLGDFFQGSIEVLSELENDYGPFPHDKLLVYATPNGGGMEYCGATITSYRALKHEITHSYFARGVKPMNGNSGWIDEAIASWRDNGYKTYSSLSVFSANMASRSVYRRKTDRAAYSDGANFMAHLNYLLSSQGGLKSYLEFLVQRHLFHSIDNEMFVQGLEDFTGEDFRPLFKKYIYKKSERGPESKVFNPFHPPVTKEYLKSLL